MKLAVGLGCLGLGVILYGYFVSHHSSDSTTVRPVTPAVEQSPSHRTEDAAKVVLARAESVSAPTREAVQTNQPQTDGGSFGLVQVPVPPETAQLIGDQRVRIMALERQIEQLRRELDECKNGSFSVLGLVRSLPDWEKLDVAQRRTVMTFLERFPVQLATGEASLIATYTSKTGDTTSDLIGLLGRKRVLDSMSKEAREKFEREDPDEFKEYFGRP